MKLEKLTLKDGAFFTDKGTRVKVRVVGIDLAKVDNASNSPFAREIPSEANAFAQGPYFDLNDGGWRNSSLYVAPTVYLKIVRQ